MLQRHAVQKLHDQERMAVLLADFIDRADIGMVEGRRSLSLSLETSQCLGISGDIVRQEFQGDKAMESGVLSLIHNTHPAAAELLDDAVVRDVLTDQFERTPILGTNLRVDARASQRRSSHMVFIG